MKREKCAYFGEFSVKVMYIEWRPVIGYGAKWHNIIVCSSYTHCKNIGLSALTVFSTSQNNYNIIGKDTYHER